MGVLRCKDCRKPFTVKVGTIFEDSHIPMRLWLQAIALMCVSKKGISSELVRQPVQQRQPDLHGLMAAPMVLFELLLMGRMYENKWLTITIGAISTVAMVAFFVAIRQQAAVTDSQFLRSMIPHHAGAVLICEKAALQSAEIKQLCTSIISGQEAEIRQMKKLLQK